MSVTDLHPWLKALHVAAALVFVGSVVAVSVFLAAIASAPPGSVSPDLARAVRRWDQAATTPAMLLVWASGLALALAGERLAEPWLQAKLVFVIVLSGVHGVQSGRLRRVAGGAPARPLRSAPVVLACILTIAVLAVVKP